MSTQSPFLADCGSDRILLRSQDTTAPVGPYNIPLHISTITGGSSLTAAQSTFLIPGTPPVALPALVSKHITTSLIALAPICDLGYQVLLSSDRLDLIQHGAVVATAPKAPSDRLWSFPAMQLQPPDTTSNYIVSHQLNAELVAFYHAALGSPPISSLITAVQRGFLRSIPGLTVERIRKNPPKSPATDRGHMQRLRQGLRSTSSSDMASPPADLGDQDTQLDSADTCITHVFSVADQRHAYSDATGRLPLASRHGSEYILVSVLDGYIHAVPMPSREEQAYIIAYTHTINFWRDRGRAPQIQHMDNEISAGVIRLFQQTFHMQLDLAPPYSHRANNAERAIQTYKNDWISMLLTADPMCPLELWEDAMPQLEVVTNVLRPYPPNPTISCFEGMWGHPFDFAAHPIAPFGTRVETLSHGTGKWGAKSQAGWYVSFAPMAYRQFHIFVLSTRQVITTDSVSWYSKFRIPGSSPAELLLAAINDFARSLDHVSTCINEPEQASFQQHSQPLVSQLQDVARLFQRVGDIDSGVPVPPPVLVRGQLGVPQAPPHTPALPGLQLGVPAAQAPPQHGPQLGVPAAQPTAQPGLQLGVPAAQAPAISPPTMPAAHQPPNTPQPSTVLVPPTIATALSRPRPRTKKPKPAPQEASWTSHPPPYRTPGTGGRHAAHADAQCQQACDSIY